MPDLKYYLNTDNFKIGHYGDKHVKNINLTLFISSIVIVVTLVFYLLMYSFTNFRTLDDLKDYSEEYKKNQDKFFSSINLAVKIMPSYNTQGNAIWAERTNNVSVIKFRLMIQLFLDQKV